MNINVYTNRFHSVVLDLSHLLNIYAPTAIYTNGEYSNILFDGDDEAQERFDIFFNPDRPRDINVYLNPASSTEKTIIITDSAFELSQIIKANHFTGELFVISPNAISGLFRGIEKAFNTENLKVKSYFIPFNEKDMVYLNNFGISVKIMYDRMSKQYQSALIDIFNLLTGNTFSSKKALEKFIKQKNKADKEHTKKDEEK